MHYITAIMSAFSSSVTSIFGKLSLNVGASALQILLLRFFFSLIISGVFFVLLKKKVNIKYLMFFGTFGIINYGIAAYLFFYGLKFLNPAYATVLFFSNPIFVLIFQKLIYKGNFSVFNLIAVVLSFTGIILSNLAEKRIGGSENLIFGSFLVILAAIFNALFITLVGDKIKKLKLNPFESSFYTFLGVTILYFIISIANKELYTLKLDYYIYGLLLAVFSTLIPLTLNYFSLRKINSTTLSLIMPLEIVFASILSFIFFDEIFNILKVLGFSFVVAAPILERVKIKK
ncbi:drug/metabolite transporter (DMT)-like permease [Thermosipho japonicus]|uniref:Drug/metabolite transporter (DMT)-like permease n=1 Tax=Thermosipho japonicus TaxID=90323 RepID=A0A841GHH1_9BACT|nr:DMT family transporter [Thermosipho japonicus]MBB6063072.1 drug/metabolite transporter (DMT)-like permease [Thermosipho japonicus]